MVRLNFAAILITIIWHSLAVKVNSKNIRTELLTWEENHYMKDLTKEDIPEDCQKIGICSNITIYDIQFVNTLLKRLKYYKKFNVDQVTVPHSYNLGEIEELCASKQEIIWPQAAKDEAGQWQYIVNTNSIWFQGYRIQRCIESGSSCSKAAIFSGFDNACYQEISLRKMVYIDVQNKKLATNYFQVPNCCSCKITES